MIGLTIGTPATATAFVTSGVTVTKSFTMPTGDDGLALFFVRYSGTATNTTPTYGGNSCTLVGQIGANNAPRHMVYALKNPPTGANDFVITFSIASGNLAMSFVPVFGAADTSIWGTVQTINTTNTTYSVPDITWRSPSELGLGASGTVRNVNANVTITANGQGHTRLTLAQLAAAASVFNAASWHSGKRATTGFSYGNSTTGNTSHALAFPVMPKYWGYAAAAA